MLFILENAGHRLEVEAADLPSALLHALNNWQPARMACSREPTLSRHLLVDGVPLLDALAAHEQARAAA